MVSDYRPHNPGVVPPSPHLIMESQRRLSVRCPGCGERIALLVGLCGHRRIDAVLLQCERIGAELECPHCDLKFVLQRQRHAPMSQQSQQLAKLAKRSQPVSATVPSAKDPSGTHER